MAYGPVPRHRPTGPLPAEPRLRPKQRAWLQVADGLAEVQAGMARMERGFRTLASTEDANNVPPVDLIPARVAAQALGLSVSTVRAKVASEELAGRKIGARVFVHKSALNGHAEDA